MDKTIGKTFTKIMGEGEKKAPVKDIKLKVKFQKEKESCDEKKEKMAKKMK